MENVCGVTYGPFMQLPALAGVPDLLYYTFIPSIVLNFFLLLMLFLNKKILLTNRVKAFSLTVIFLYQILLIAFWSVTSHPLIKFIWWFDVPLELLMTIPVFIYVVQEFKNSGYLSTVWKQVVTTSYVATLITLFIFSFTPYTIYNYDYISCEPMLGPVWYILIFIQLVLSVCALVFSIKNYADTRKVSWKLLFAIVPIITLGYTNLSFFIYENWFNDIAFPVALTIYFISILYTNLDLKKRLQTRSWFIPFLVIMTFAFTLGLVSLLFTTKYWLLVLVSSVTFLVSLFGIIIFWKKVKVYQSVNKEMVNQNKELLVSISPENTTSEPGTSVTPAKVHDRLSDIINNMMLAMPGGQYRKLEFLPHTTGQVAHMVQVLFSGPTTVTGSVVNKKVLVDVGFLVEMIKSIVGGSAESVCTNPITIEHGAVTMTITISDIPHREFKDSEEKMARLMSITMTRVNDVVTLVIPILSEEEWDTAEY